MAHLSRELLIIITYLTHIIRIVIGVSLLLWSSFSGILAQRLDTLEHVLLPPHRVTGSLKAQSSFSWTVHNQNLKNGGPVGEQLAVEEENASQVLVVLAVPFVLGIQIQSRPTCLSQASWSISNDISICKLGEPIMHQVAVQISPISKQSPQDLSSLFSP